MSFIATNKVFQLPLKIAEMILNRNPTGNINYLENSFWCLEAHTIYVYKTWFTELYPYPWNEALYNILFKLSWGPYIKQYENLFILSDSPFTDVSFPISSLLASFIN